MFFIRPSTLPWMVSFLANIRELSNVDHYNDSFFWFVLKFIHSSQGVYKTPVLVRWSSWLGHLPVTEEITGSSPVRTVSMESYSSGLRGWFAKPLVRYKDVAWVRIPYFPFILYMENYPSGWRGRSRKPLGRHLSAQEFESLILLCGLFDVGRPSLHSQNRPTCTPSDWVKPFRAYHARISNVQELCNWQLKCCPLILMRLTILLPKASVMNRLL